MIGNSLVSSFLTSAQSRATSLIAKATTFFAKFSPMYITRVVDALAESRQGIENDSFCYFDPMNTTTGVCVGAESRWLWCVVRYTYTYMMCIDCTLLVPAR